MSVMEQFLTKREEPRARSMRVQFHNLIHRQPAKTVKQKIMKTQTGAMQEQITAARNRM